MKLKRVITVAVLLTVGSGVVCGQFSDWFLGVADDEGEEDAEDEEVQEASQQRSLEAPQPLETVQ